MARILVTGASGLVGSRLAVFLREAHEVHGTYHAHRPDFLHHDPERLYRVDVRDLDAFAALLAAVAPEVVVHCAAWTNVDACEGDPAQAFAANVRPVELLASWSRARGARAVQLSTDYVFDGTRPPYEIDAPANPLCVYSKSKADAEAAIRQAPGSLIVRSTVIFGADYGHLKRNFATWLIGELRAGRRVRVVNDQWSTPTIAENIAQFVGRALDRAVTGVVHAAVGECMPRDEFARRIAARFELDASLIEPVATEAIGQAARRPKRPCLSMRRSEELLGAKAWTFASSLDLLHRQLEAYDPSVLKSWW